MRCDSERGEGDFKHMIQNNPHVDSEGRWNGLIDLSEARKRVDAEDEWNRLNIPEKPKKPETEEERLRGIILTFKGIMEVAIAEGSWDSVEEAYIHLERSGI